MVYKKYAKKSNYSKKLKNYNRKRKRFVRKTFTRSPPKLRAGLYIPNQAMIKLPFTRFLTTDMIASGGVYGLPIWGTGICCPLTASTGGTPSSGDIYPLGVVQYSDLYQYYKVMGASCKVQINNSTLVSGDSTATAQSSALCALLAVQGVPYSTDTGSNYQKIIAADTQDLVSYPHCSWNLVSHNVGSRQNIYLKKFVKTKTMIGVKDVLDVDELQGLLPNNTSSSLSPRGTNPTSDDSNFFFYLRIDPSVTAITPSSSFQIVLKMKYYVMLYGRDFNTQGVAK